MFGQSEGEREKEDEGGRNQKISGRRGGMRLRGW